MHTLSTKPVYTSGVASDILKINQKTIVNYENAGLIKIQKNTGGRRLFSQRDLFDVLVIQWLIKDRGLNMKGIKLVNKLIQTAEQEDIDLYTTILPESVRNKFISKVSIG
ncbi:MerR family transcriptional regulator [Candidatus Dojkabacteria bacterium]|uniref:MerR family transcriptional regulator n=1 Tax=Candidatus Dojkabacteria bacterium TaxID=2099670 RepID=A0A955L7Z4_9BACT|nr:MerR family transcriptional regulator [Candidatus Dojkabacteria bacterium]